MLVVGVAFMGTSLSNATVMRLNSADLESHEPIRIVGDSGFTNDSGVTWGSGTPEDPYVIQGWDASVSITNTTAHVIVRNMTMLGYRANIWYAGGLYLTNVSHCVVESCSLVPAPDEDYTILWIASCSNVTVRNNSIEKYVNIQTSRDIRFESNLVLEYNIEVIQSERVDVCDNILIDPSEHLYPGWAIRVNESQSVNILHNHIENRTVTDWSGSYGLLLETSSSVVVAGNSFLNNTHQAQDSSGDENTWNMSYPIGGNYWSDYSGTDLFQGPGQDIPGSDGIGDSPYIIDADSEDFYPLMNPPAAPNWSDSDPPFTKVVIEGDQEQSGWYVTSVYITMSAFDVGSGVNRTMYALGTGSWQEYIAPLVLLIDGAYNLTYFSEDNSGNPSQVEAIEVNIDQHDPILVLHQTNDAVFESGNVSISWSCWDNASGIDHYEYRLDGVYYSTDNSTVLLANLLEGSHRLTVFAYDVAGNMASQLIYFNVSFEDQSNEEPNDSNTALLLIGVSAIAISAIVATVAVLIRRSRAKGSS